MAKRVGQVEDRWAADGQFTGRVETHKVGRAKTTEIPWTPGPQTRWQKIVRAAVG